MGPVVSVTEVGWTISHITTGLCESVVLHVTMDEWWNDNWKAKTEVLEGEAASVPLSWN